VGSANDYVNGSQLCAPPMAAVWTTQYRPSAAEGDGRLLRRRRRSGLLTAGGPAFYFAQLCFFRAFLPSEIGVISPPTTGRTWTGSRTGHPISTQPEAHDFNPAFYDKEQITVDNNPSARTGRITSPSDSHAAHGFSDYCPVQVAYTDNIDPNGDGDLTDAVWHHTGISPDNPGGNGKGPSANQGVQPVVDNQGGLDVSYMTEECNTSLDHGIFFRRSTNGGASFGAAKQINKPGQWADNPNPDDLLPPKRARIASSTSAPLVFNPGRQVAELHVQNNVNRAKTVPSRSRSRGLRPDLVERDVANGSSAAPNDQFFVDGRHPKGSCAPSGSQRNGARQHQHQTFEAARGSTGATGQQDIGTQRWTRTRASSARVRSSATTRRDARATGDVSAVDGWPTPRTPRPDRHLDRRRAEELPLGPLRAGRRPCARRRGRIVSPSRVEHGRDSLRSRRIGRLGAGLSFALVVAGLTAGGASSFDGAPGAAAPVAHRRAGLQLQVMTSTDWRRPGSGQAAAGNQRVELSTAGLATVRC
jgi:hypothetical protein